METARSNPRPTINTGLVRKGEIFGISVHVLTAGQSALTLIINKDGSLHRQGNGAIPPLNVTVLGMTDGSYFREAIDRLDERLLDLGGVYDHPDKSGVPVEYEIAFAGERGVRTFRFSLGTMTRSVGDVFPRLDAFVSKLVEMTDEWYSKNAGG